MADVIKRNKKKKYAIDAKFELEVDGVVKEYPIKATIGDLLKAESFNQTCSEDGNIQGFMDYIKYEFFKLPKGLNVSFEELLNALEAVGEYIRDNTPSRAKKL